MRFTRGKVAANVVMAIIVLAFLLFHFLPLPDALNEQDYAKILLAGNGQLLAGKIAKDHQWRFPPNPVLPKKYVRAVLAFEDKYFYYHPGLNPFSLARAFWANYRAGKVVSGGSTISMQLARIIREDPPRTYRNKLIEMFLAFKIEWHFSKDEILSLYASKAPFGGNTVGIGAASWRYFGRHLQDQNAVSQLSWAEAALLGVLPNSPGLIHPGRSRDRLKKKRDALLKTLYQSGIIDQNDYSLSLLEPLPDKPRPLPRLAPHLLETLLSQHPDRDLFSSTLNARLQSKINALSRLTGKHLAADGVHNLSVVVIDNQTLQTTAYIGNHTSGTNTRLHGRSVDIANRPRSTGSILKPLLYALMLQSGDILPNTLVPDIPMDFDGFTPENYDRQYRGAIPAKQALAQSLNIPAVHMLKQYGVSRFHDDLVQLGMTTLFRPPDDYGLSLILGGAEGTLWELTGIYAQLVQIVRKGWGSKTPTAITLLNNFNAPHPQQQSRSPIQAGAAWLSLDALLEVRRPGHEHLWRTFANNQKIAWKTGTSYGLRDAWAIGSNGKYTVGVWAGNANGTAIPGLSGLKTAAPLLFQTFEILGHAQWPRQPEYALKEVRTCVNDGYLAAGRCASEKSLAPIRSHFQKVSPFHQNIQLDQGENWRVHGDCENVRNMKTKSWFVLPAAQAYYWQQHHHETPGLPPWREDCVASLANYTDELPMELVYPLEGSKIYIPIGLDGKKGKVIFRVSHRDPNARLYWHIDEHFIRETDLFHDVALDLDAGWHKLIVVDHLGFRLERHFRVLKSTTKNKTI